MSKIEYEAPTIVVHASHASMPSDVARVAIWILRVFIGCAMLSLIALIMRGELRQGSDFALPIITPVVLLLGEGYFQLRRWNHRRAVRSNQALHVRVAHKRTRVYGFTASATLPNYTLDLQVLNMTRPIVIRSAIDGDTYFKLKVGDEFDIRLTRKWPYAWTRDNER